MYVFISRLEITDKECVKFLTLKLLYLVFLIFVAMEIKIKL